ncbi:MAG TPA: hypothetical protein VIX37_22720, partial [Candidatus Sulfotelmatobacter sp.]
MPERGKPTLGRHWVNTFATSGVTASMALTLRSQPNPRDDSGLRKCAWKYRREILIPAVLS